MVERRPLGRRPPPRPPLHLEPRPDERPAAEAAAAPLQRRFFFALFFASVVACAWARRSLITGQGRPLSRRIPSHPPFPTYGGTKKCFGSAATSDSCAPSGALHQTAT